MADALSRLKRKGLYEAQGQEPNGAEFDTLFWRVYLRLMSTKLM